MTIVPSSKDKLWTQPRKYRCGCERIEGKGYCPTHGEPLQEMIYGNKSKADTLYERQAYEKQNLNED